MNPSIDLVQARHYFLLEIFELPFTRSIEQHLLTRILRVANHVVLLQNLQTLLDVFLERGVIWIATLVTGVNLISLSCRGSPHFDDSEQAGSFTLDTILLLVVFDELLQGHVASAAPLLSQVGGATTRVLNVILNLL